MNRLFFLMLSIAFVLLVWLNIEQTKGIENHNSQAMQLEQRARVISNGGIYNE